MQWFLHESDAAVFSFLVNREDDPCRWFGRAAELLALPAMNVCMYVCIYMAFYLLFVICHQVMVWCMYVCMFYVCIS